MDTTAAVGAIETVKTAFESGINAAQGSIMDFMATALPVALVVVGAVVAVKFGIKFFRSTAK